MSRKIVIPATEGKSIAHFVSFSGDLLNMKSVEIRVCSNAYDAEGKPLFKDAEWHSAMLEEVGSELGDIKEEFLMLSKRVVEAVWKYNDDKNSSIANQGETIA